MKSNYETIIQDNLHQLFSDDLDVRAAAMGAERTGRSLHLRAFGLPCRMTPDGIFLSEHPQTGPMGIILSLYALNAFPDPFQLEPFKAFKEIPDSMPYVGAFASHTEQILVPGADKIMNDTQKIVESLDGQPAPSQVGGDAAFVVRPLPKIALCYIFYAADEDFPASATCLYSANAHRHMPVDGLADVGEYTSRTILDLIT